MDSSLKYSRRKMDVEAQVRRFRKTEGFLKKEQPTGFYWVLGFVRFQILYLNEQSGSLLFDLAHQLSFYLDSTEL